MSDPLLPLSATALPAPDWRACARVRARGATGTGHAVFVDAGIDDLAQRQVYRYCSLPEAIEWLSARRWSFVDPARWPDPYERHVTDRLFGDGGRFARLGVYAKCVSLDFGSHALWSMYAGKTGVVRIGIRLQNLVAMLGGAAVLTEGSGVAPAARFFLTRCRYMAAARLARAVGQVARERAPATAESAMRALAMKRDGFRYENEVRIAMLLRAGRGPRAPARTLVLRSLPVESVMVDPYLPPHEAAPLVALFAQLAPNARVRQSDFNASPSAD